MDRIGNVLAGYGFDIESSKIENFGNGLINDTWLVENGSSRFILQSINTAVFREPLLIADNLEKIGDYLQKEKEDYFFTSPMKTLDGESMIEVDGQYYRAFPFVKGSRSVDTVETTHQAYEAARQFGKFTKVLSGIDIKTINTTLPHFHDPSLRYQQFSDAIKENRSGRLNSALDLVHQLQSHSGIVSEYEKIKQSSQFKQRVTHHDTKISNVLFDGDDKGICVIDLDTVMPGYFISDVGDMMRTYLSPVSEDEGNFDNIEIRNDFYFSIAKGYLEYMGDELSEYEKKHFFYSGKFIIYMQALRFLTDHLNGDTYYGARYPIHNYVRAKNQTTLLQRLIEKEPELSFANIGIF